LVIGYKDTILNFNLCYSKTYKIWEHLKQGGCDHRRKQRYWLCYCKRIYCTRCNGIITGKRKDALEKAAKEIGAKAILANQSNLQEIENLVTEVKNTYGMIDILFLNAGVA
jgi:hypothetical protein